MSDSPPKNTGYVSGEDSATIEANRVYQDALDKLAQSLDTRKNRFFDPVWLAAAQGFGAPTQTGGFGESLGIVAKNVSAAQDQEAKQEQEIAQQRVAAAGKGVELQRMRARDAEKAKYLEGDQPPAPLAGPLSAPVAGPRAAPEALTGPLPTRISTIENPPAPPVVATTAPVIPPSAIQPGALPASAPAVVAQAPKGGLPDAGNRGNNRGIQISPPIEGSVATFRDYVRMNQHSDKSLFDLQQEWQDIQRKNLEVKDNFVFNRATGVMNPINAQPLDLQIYGPGYSGGTYKVSPANALRLSQLLEEKKYDEYTALADLITGKNFGQPAGSKPATGGSAPVTGGSVEERLLEAEKAKALEAARTAQEIEDRKNFVQKGRDADDQITLASQFRKFASDPNAGKMVGILNNDKVSSAIAKALESGIGSRNYRIGIPEIQEIMRNADLNPTEQATYRTFLMLVVNSQLQKTKYLKGSISNYEDQLLASAGINAQDTVETIRIKSDLMTRGAQFDRLVAKTFKASKMTADEFLDSDKYNQLRDKYNSDMAELSFGGKTLAPDQAAQRNPSPAAPAARQPSPGFIQGPDGVIRRKKAGE